MIRWLLVTVLALVLMSGLTDWLRRFGFGRLPGDFVFRAFGRLWQVPLPKINPELPPGSPSGGPGGP